ncbi:hypothetical protein AD98_01320 [Klebsiella pneumoniae MGH 72]|nr:hypothetical protein AD98_01320 [Klebsiella pneumoniae MGH 72]SBG36247.1 Uncharacterised protein [Klebsiella pneumoniae]SLV62829.1 Uncharacterised protein [Klebsiella pneumoniae]SLV82046.1 Uncharacterised protein [Klebsiella pneumoniae]SLX67543.1 Uncharacterised protein [Klebsiella pneumoniae]
MVAHHLHIRDCRRVSSLKRGDAAVYHLDERLFGITQAISNTAAIAVEVIHVQAYTSNLLQCVQHIIWYYRLLRVAIELVASF